MSEQKTTQQPEQELSEQRRVRRFVKLGHMHMARAYFQRAHGL